jgi:hypothetical protein
MPAPVHPRCAVRKHDDRGNGAGDDGSGDERAAFARADHHGARALSRSPHRTGALAHGLAEIWLTALASARNGSTFTF